VSFVDIDIGPDLRDDRGCNALLQREDIVAVFGEVGRPDLGQYRRFDQPDPRLAFSAICPSSEHSAQHGA
jgi:hypothetical protein